MQLSLTLTQAQKKIDALKDEHVQAVLKVLAGDQWQDGKGWIGPFYDKIRAGDINAAALVKAGFVSRDVIGEGKDRHVEGVVGHEPAWNATVRRVVNEKNKLLPDEEARIAEVEGALVEWWDKREMLTLLQEEASLLVAAKRAIMRLFVPPGRRVPMKGGYGIPEPSGTPEEKLKAALDYLFPAVADLDSAGVFLDLDTMEKYGVYVHTPLDDTDDKAKGKDYAEITYPDGDGKEFTIMEIRTKGGGDDDESQVYRFPWKGRLPIYEMSRKQLITPSALSQQRKLNLSETMEGRNIVTAGSPERWIFNASPPGSWEDDPANPGQKRFVPSALNIGGGVTNLLGGILIEEQDKDGVTRKTITDPHIERLDPASVDIFESVSDRAAASILSEMKQRHVLMTGDGNASAVSRVQARADYLNSLLLTKTEIDAMIRWLLETAIVIASGFAGLGDRYADLRIFASAKLDTGPLTPDEQRVIVERYKAGTLSKESTMHLLGVEDVDAEIARIEAEEAASLVVQKARADIVATLVQQAQMDLVVAMEIAGYSASEINAAKKAQEERDAMAQAIAEGQAGAAEGGEEEGNNGQPPTPPSQEEEEPTEENEEEQE